MAKPFLRALAGERLPRPPIWLMRQAGRYLPEYRQIRAKVGRFLDLCYTPDIATEVTLQPIRRYGFDAAILFSDILVVPDALGQHVRFIENEGPILLGLKDGREVLDFDKDRFLGHLAPVYQAVRQIKKALPAGVALIGFAGAPWTVATYMVEGRGGTDHLESRMFAYTEPLLFGRLIEILTEATIEHLSAQIAAGAEAVQLFDTWAGALAEPGFRQWCIEPGQRIVAELRARHPDIRIIGFPRGAGALYAAYAMETKVDAVSLDTTVSASWASSALQGRGIAVQGNLDPVLLIAGGEALDEEVDRLLSTLGGGPWIFNLGHGIQQATPPENVARLVERIRRWSAR